MLSIWIATLFAAASCAPTQMPSQGNQNELRDALDRIEYNARDASGAVRSLASDVDEKFASFEGRLALIQSLQEGTQGRAQEVFNRMSAIENDLGRIIGQLNTIEQKVNRPAPRSFNSGYLPLARPRKTNKMGLPQSSYQSFPLPGYPAPDRLHCYDHIEGRNCADNILEKCILCRTSNDCAARCEELGSPCRAFSFIPSRLSCLLKSDTCAADEMKMNTGVQYFVKRAKDGGECEGKTEESNQPSFRFPSPSNSVISPPAKGAALPDSNAVAEAAAAERSVCFELQSEVCALTSDALPYYGFNSASNPIAPADRVKSDTVNGVSLERCRRQCQIMRAGCSGVYYDETARSCFVKQLPCSSFSPASRNPSAQRFYRKKDC